RAGWPDDRPVWTGSCPCQPFSTAGKGAGFDDERHLWPALHHLIRECNPPVVFGEQVASKDGLAWIELVRTDLEGENYAVAAADLCAAGVGAPHIRQRLYWVADTVHTGRAEGWTLAGDRQASWSGCPDGVGHTNHPRLEGHGRGHQTEGRGQGSVRPVAEAGEPCGLADSDQQQQHGRGDVGERGRTQPANLDVVGGVGPTNGRWRDADWLHCRDGKWRPVEPGTFPLAHGAPARVGRLRAYGNAIVPQVAQVFIESYLETQDPPPVG
ncbi:MAG TPA: DNA cytosine methyltransferase, partial [Aquabacterium sp.]|nr:DNA cytosine methyltransferase [Aquabacterium sp.]